MASSTLEHKKDGHEAAPDQVYHQFEDLAQQEESYVVGMWAFLITEIMFFGGLFIAYILYRWQFQPQFYLIHKELDPRLGGLNTMVLLTSSFTMAMAVHFAQRKMRAKQHLMLGITLLCAFGFLIIKTIEWTAKYEHHLMPWANFSWPPHDALAAHPEFADIPAGVAKMFFSIYFAMTGSHAIHVIIGIICIGTMMVLTARKSILAESYINTELVGLYWHFVDLVWIFLFPLFYLLPQ